MPCPLSHFPSLGQYSATILTPWQREYSMTSKFVIGVPKEIKTDEYRVAMIPVGVEELTRAGHHVLIQAGAGQGSGISDEQYAIHGAEVVPDAASVWKRADLIV